MKLFTQTAMAVLFAANTAFADEYKVADLTVDHPMIFETAKSVKVAGGYMTITNTGTTADTLLEVRTAAVPRVELHLSQTDENGVARMIKQDGIEIPAGSTVTLKPGGLHVMFMGLSDDPLEEGEKIDATLVFQTAGELAVTFNIEERSAGDHGGMDHSGHMKTD